MVLRGFLRLSSGTPHNSSKIFCKAAATANPSLLSTTMLSTFTRILSSLAMTTLHAVAPGPELELDHQVPWAQGIPVQKFNSHRFWKPTIRTTVPSDTGPDLSPRRLASRTRPRHSSTRVLALEALPGLETAPLRTSEDLLETRHEPHRHAALCALPLSTPASRNTAAAGPSRGGNLHGCVSRKAHKT